MNVLAWYNEVGSPDSLWHTWHNRGRYIIDVPQARDVDEVGVGSFETLQVSIAHICKQELGYVGDYEPCSVDICY